MAHYAVLSTGDKVIGVRTSHHRYTHAVIQRLDDRSLVVLSWHRSRTAADRVARAWGRKGQIAHVTETRTRKRIGDVVMRRCCLNNDTGCYDQQCTCTCDQCRVAR